jgi:hypothetical protein
MDNVITNLKIISIVQVNEKLCIRKGHLQIDNIIKLQFLSRWFYRDSRDVILNFINDLIKNIFYFLHNTDKYTDYLWNLTHLLTELEHVENGLENLKTTYIYDPYMIVNIDHINTKFKELAYQARQITLPG